MSPRTFNRSCSDMLSIRSPLTRMTPRSGFNSPRINFRTTDFPDPLAPSRKSVLPVRTEKVTSRSTTFSSNASDTFSNAIAGTSRLPALGVIDAVDRQLLREVIVVLVRIRGPRLRINERGQQLGIFIARAARIEIRHGIADDARQRVDASSAGAVIPRVRPPQRSRFLITNRHSLTVRTVAGDAALLENRFTFPRLQCLD